MQQNNVLSRERNARRSKYRTTKTNSNTSTHTTTGTPPNQESYNHTSVRYRYLQEFLNQTKVFLLNKTEQDKKNKRCYRIPNSWDRTGYPRANKRLSRLLFPSESGKLSQLAEILYLGAKL